MPDLPWSILAQGSGLGAFLLLVAFIVAGYRRLGQDGEAAYTARIEGIRADLAQVRADRDADAVTHATELAGVRARLAECRAESHELVDQLAEVRLELVALRAELATIRAGRPPTDPT